MKNDVKLERKLNPLNVWALALGSIIGWGAFVMDFIRYEETPPVVQAKVIEDAKAFNLAEDDE